MQQTISAIIAIGASLPYHQRIPDETIKLAIAILDRSFGVECASSLYQSPAWPDPLDPPFCNAVVVCRTGANTPAEMLARLHVIEASFGRVRHRRNGPRTLDLDLLAFGDLVLRDDDENSSRPKKTELPNPVLPHPAMSLRDFVMAPLVEIWPDWVHPTEQVTAKELLERLGPVTAVRK